MIYRIIKGLIRLVIIIRRIRWVQLFKLYDKNADVILWIPAKKLNYLIGDAVLWDAASINSLVINGIKFRILYGSKVGKLSNKIIFHTINRGVNIFEFSNYADIYQHITSQLEVQGNKLFPNTYEVSYWENKGYMHSQFKKLHVSEPNTELYTFEEIDKIQNLAFPFLIKTEHSCSAKGVFKIENKEVFSNLITSDKFRLENKTVIKQELINMRKDLRVILVGNEIVHHYWRINKSKEWKPTSTSFGSDVDFENFPEQWRTHILETFKILNITTGAFDITWQNDDLNNLPLYLEVSPVFQPNPKIELQGKEYAYYKKSFSPFNSYDNKFVDLIFEIKHKQMNFILKTNQIPII
jgi:hypothetical protein